jgi:RNA recognition motif-containing protein
MPKIIVSNLPSNFTQEDIRKMFGIYGEILHINRTKDTNNTFISYRLKEECTKAIDSFNGKILKGERPLIIDYAYDRDSKVYVFNLPLDSDIVDLKSFFTYYGNIECIKFIKNVLMIIFENKKDSLRLLDLNNKINYCGKLLGIRNTIKNEIVIDDNKCVFVYNISEEVTELDFLRMFSKYGDVLSSGISENGRGYVNYEKEIGAYKAVKYLDGFKVKNKKLRVMLKSEKNKK